MTTRPRPTLAVHFTHIDNLAGIVADGLASDVLVRQTSRRVTAVGDPAIKTRRRGRPVGCGPGGSVGNYVPLYYAARSPMMYLLQKQGMSFERVIYLQTSVERVQMLGLTWAASDRNAALSLAEFTDVDTRLDTHIDWAVIAADQWGKTPQDPERPARRQAELLVHRVLPWEAVERVVTKTSTTAAEVRRILATPGRSVKVDVIPRWYF